MPKKFTLGKSERLKSRKEIDLVFSEGKSFTVFPFKVYYRQNAMGNEQLNPPKNKRVTQNKEHLTRDLKPKVQNFKTSLQFGIGVSGKLFPRAVDRNQIKRLTREAYRLQKIELQEKLANMNYRLFVFFVYSAKELSDFHIIWEKTGLILKKLCKVADEKSFAGT